ncbi:MAG: dienelactone hydrolase family protein [candidate division KSB1 bacterium]|nr:dienelactone hydrolase family protein [candidate division KSB1 bacterium]MDZ7303909.1 dienelactone hydrolase family protein [candidate division KSB1 bacterium]MDZ7313070.1 dienelactone hydrolase family protein [candidate division KSB1 bacterium]
MRVSGLILASFITLTTAALIYHRASTSVKTQMVQYKSGDETVSAFLAFPEGKGPFPAIIVIHEWWGLNDWIKDNAKTFADKGYLALAIDLYRGQIATDSELAHELSRGLPEDRAIRDLRAAFAYLTSRKEVQPDKIGCIGWCMGGGYSLQAALHLPRLAACVINYGRMVTDSTMIEKINCPILGIFGGKDRGIPVKDVQAFQAACIAAGKNITVHIYPNSGHAFMNENNTRGYNAADARNAREKIFAFFEQTLKQ